MILLKEMKQEEKRLFLILRLWDLRIRFPCLFGNAVELLPSFDKVYDFVFIDASKSKYPFFLSEAIRMSKRRYFDYC